MFQPISCRKANSGLPMTITLCFSLHFPVTHTSKNYHLNWCLLCDVYLRFVGLFVCFLMIKHQSNDLPISGNMTRDKYALFPMPESWELSKSSLDFKARTDTSKRFLVLLLLLSPWTSTWSLVKLQTLEKLQFGFQRCHPQKQMGNCHSDYQWSNYLDAIHMESNCTCSMLHSLLPEEDLDMAYAHEHLT